MAEARLPADRKQQHINNDEINETVYGFITENSPIDLIRFWLQTTTGELYFDYKIKQDQQGQWQVWAMVWIQAHFSLPILPLNHRNKLFIPPYFLPTGGIFLSFPLTDQKQTALKPSSPTLQQPLPKLLADPTSKQILYGKAVIPPKE